MEVMSLEMQKKLYNEFYEDPSTEDMDFQEFLKWKGWRFDPNLGKWVRTI